MRALKRRASQARNFIQIFYQSLLFPKNNADKILRMPVRIYAAQVIAILLAISALTAVVINFYVGENRDQIVTILHDTALKLEQRIPLQVDQSQKDYVVNNVHYWRSMEQEVKSSLKSITQYQTISKIISPIALPVFVLISGYVFSAIAVGRSNLQKFDATKHNFQIIILSLLLAVSVLLVPLMEAREQYEIVKAVTYIRGRINLSCYVGVKDHDIPVMFYNSANEMAKFSGPFYRMGEFVDKIIFAPFLLTVILYAYALYRLLVTTRINKFRLIASALAAYICFIVLNLFLSAIIPSSAVAGDKQEPCMTEPYSSYRH